MNKLWLGFIAVGITAATVGCFILMLGMGSIIGLFASLPFFFLATYSALEAYLNRDQSNPLFKRNPK